MNEFVAEQARNLTILTHNQTKWNKSSNYHLTSKKQLGWETENMLLTGSTALPNHGEY